MKKLFIFFLALYCFSGCNAFDDKWTQENRDSYINGCVDRLGVYPNAKSICTCLQQKDEKQFPQYRDYRHLSSEFGAEDIKQCRDGAVKN